MKSLLNLLMLVVLVWVLFLSWSNASERKVSDADEETFVSQGNGADFLLTDEFSWDDPLSPWPKARSVWN